jgi:hypothetical protein
LLLTGRLKVFADLLFAFVVMLLDLLSLLFVFVAVLLDLAGLLFVFVAVLLDLVGLLLVLVGIDESSISRVLHDSANDMPRMEAGA